MSILSCIERIVLPRSVYPSGYETVFDRSSFKSDRILFAIKRGLFVFKPSSSTRGRTPVVLTF